MKLNKAAIDLLRAEQCITLGELACSAKVSKIPFTRDLQETLTRCQWERLLGHSTCRSRTLSLKRNRSMSACRV